LSKVAIVTDSNSGITQAQAKELGIRVMPMPFYINEEMLLEDIDLTQEQFYERLTEGADIHTSTPVLTNFTDLWDELLEEYDEIIFRCPADFPVPVPQRPCWHRITTEKYLL
jgi:fatty acid-binding protein DegV